MKKDNKSWPHSLFIVFILITSCNKDDTERFYILNPWVEYGRVTDIEGNAYKTILIGSQIWMAQNLKTTKLNDGTSIPVVSDISAWNSLSTPTCCWQENNQAYRVTYGILYNWHAVNSGKLCPAGWHIPTDADWTRLTTGLGGENIAGGKLKETGFRHWDTPNTGATNESNFWAFPGGYLSSGTEGSFLGLRKMGAWWTAMSGENRGGCRIIYGNGINVQRNFYPTTWGLSVRCVSDY